MKVIIPSPLRSYTKEREVEADGATLAELVADLDRRYPGIRFRMIDEQGGMRPHVRFFVNGEQQWDLTTPLAQCDEVQIVQALSGGSEGEEGSTVMHRASCLCGGVKWETEGPLEWMSHCHCSRCRKAHGVAFATYVAVPADKFHMDGRELVMNWESSPGFFRSFCRRCGSVVPGCAIEDRNFLPAGSFEVDPEVRPLAHIFVGSKAPWYEIRDELVQFNTYPEGLDAPVLADRAPLDPPSGTRGSCMCGAVTFVVNGEPLRCRYCHCGRCRKAHSAAHASNLSTAADAVRFTRGEDQLVSYKIPDAEHFIQMFCRTCGSIMPRIDTGRGIAIIPMGALDDDPGVRPNVHIFVGSKAPWFEIADDLPQYEEYPT